MNVAPIHSVVVTMLLATATPLAAQSRIPTGDVSGQIEAASRPLPQVTVTMRPNRRTVVSDADGAFRFRAVEPGTYQLVLMRLGYRAESLVVNVGDSPVVLRVEMVRAAQLLEPLTVSLRRLRLPDVYERQDKGLGAVLFAEDIPQYRQYDVTGLLRFVPELSAALSGVTSCATQKAYFVDGKPVPPGWDIDSYVRPEDIEAIEAHKSADFLGDSRLVQHYVFPSERRERGFGPLRFGKPASPGGLLSGTCTRVVMIWTRFYRP